MSDIVEFLEARIAEDEAEARAAIDCESHENAGYVTTILVAHDGHRHGVISVGPSRVLAECAAKRVIIAVHHPHDHGGEHGDAVFCDECQWDHGDNSPRIDNQPVEGFGAHPCRTLAVMASVYRDHPDYRSEWLFELS